MVGFKIEKSLELAEKFPINDPYDIIKGDISSFARA